jgi:hypothetical protein
MAEIRRIMASTGKKLVRPHLNKELGAVVRAYHPTVSGKLKTGGSWSRQKVRPHLRRNQSKKGWQQAQSPEFKLLVPPKK